MLAALSRQARWIPLRSLRTESTIVVRKVTTSKGKRVTTKRPSPHTLQLPPTRQMTISINRPEQATIQHVLDALASFQKTSSRQENFAAFNHHTLFILATPSFASWLEASSEFIPKALQRVLGTLRPIEVDVVCGVCDGLAPRLVSMKQPSGAGFSILHKPWKQDDLWECNPTAVSPNLQSTITFSADKGHKVTLTLPLANTLFKNGRLSTLLLSRWRSSGDSFEVTQEQTEKKNVTVNVFGKLRIPRPSIQIPSVPLTPMRRIQSGLGNIVRTIDFGEGGLPDVGPASRELEMRVTEYLSKQGLDHSVIDVWALVTPAEALSGPWSEKVKILMSGVEDLRVKRSPSTGKGCCDVGDFIDQGATLCRVLSGGGGWGIKQGLLSLDPQTTYSTSNESRYDFSEGALDEQQASALGNVAQQGAFIQFLVAAKHDEAVDPLIENERGYVDSALGSTVVGVVPSTVDEIHDISQNEDQQVPKLDVQVYLDHFGCVSESGMFLQRKGERDKSTTPAIETKIDLPYSYVYRENFKRSPLDIYKEAERVEKEVGSPDGLVRM